MEKLFQYQAGLLRNVSDHFFRYPFRLIPWKDRFIGIRGLRGVGKTTLLLQHLKYNLKDTSRHLYISLDHPYFYTHSLYDLAESFHQAGGETLLIDEVHKMKNWSVELKMIYDGLPQLQVVFTASSALDIYRGRADLSRRVHTWHLAGMSFREYLQLYHGLSVPVVTFEELLTKHIVLARGMAEQCRPLALFSDYLKRGYFPFSKNIAVESFEVRLLQTLEVVFNEDLSYVEGYTADNIFKIKKLLGILAESAPFTVNVSAIADKLGIGRNTIKEYLHAMEKAGLLNFLNREGKGISVLQKPDKIYLENPNLSYALKMHPEKGTLRETFALNQLKNGGYEVYLPELGDMLVKGASIYCIEIGGKTKNNSQLNGTRNGFVMADDIEVGYLNKIPLYLLGLLY